VTFRSLAESTWGIVAFYCALAILFTWPLLPSMTSQLPHGSNDLWQNLWNFWWWREALIEIGQTPYSTEYLFFPHGASLALHTHSTFNQIAAFPINLLLGPIAGLNFATLLGFALAGIAAHQLAYEISHDRAGAYLAGLIFAFFPHHLEQSLEHLNLSSIEFLPWVALYGLRIVRAGSLRDACLFGVVFALNALSCWHYGLFTLFVLPWIWGVELARASDLGMVVRHGLKRLSISGAIVIVIMAPFAISMLSQSASIEAYAKAPVERGSDLAFLFMPSDHHPVLGTLTESFYREHRAYSALGSQAYLGLGVLLLAALALIRSGRDRSVLTWSLIFGSSLVLALGAHPTFGSHGLGISLPHTLFEHIPILKSLRVANRFIVLAMLALAVLASIGYAALSKQRRGAAMLIFALIGFEFLWLPYPLQRVEFSPILDRLSDEASGAILDIPFSDDSTSALNLAYQTRHRRPIAGGYISVAPRDEAALGNDPVLHRLSGLTPTPPRLADIEHLRSLGFSHVVLHKDRTRQALAAALAQLSPSANFYQRRQYEGVPGMPEEIFERISNRFESALGSPSHEDARVRVFDLSR
jgi:hypothetical protein